MPSRAWPPLLAVMALALAMSVWLARSVPLIDPDEGRNAEVAREMAESGDLVIPRLAGMPYLDKPPGLFWAGAAAIRVMGNRPLAARAPAILAACLTLLLLARAATRAADMEFALRLVALTAAAPLFATLSAYVIFDMPLTLCVTVVWTGLARELSVGASGARRAAMYLAMALGVLLKGPVMLAWALGGSLTAALLMRKRDPLAWLALRRRAGNDAAPAALDDAREPGAASLRVALGFLLFAAVFFTLSRSKLVTYLLPAIPCMAWLAAVAWGRVALRLRRWSFVSTVLLFPLALLFGHGAILAYARTQSGGPLAAAIREGGGGPVRYQACYSPGTDYLLGRRGELIDVGGIQTTSNYQLRYREILEVRGLWTPREGPLGAESDANPRDLVWVRPSNSAGDPPQGWSIIYLDPRFVAFRRSAQP